MRKKTAGLMLLACFVFLGFVASLALADDQSALVVDKAKIFGGKLSQVEQAAGELQRNGADVHVWTIESFSGDANSLDGYFERLLKKFPAWQSPSGGRKNNLLILIIATKERKTGIYYGGEWSKPLGKNWIRIQSDLMNPKFRRGEFAEGFTAGIKEISRVIHEYLHPSAARPTTVIVQTKSSQPTDFSGLWTAFKWLVFLTFLSLMLFFGFRFWSNRRKEQEAKNLAKQKALIEKTSAVKKLSAIKVSIGELEPLIAVVCGLLHEAEGEKLKNKIAELKNNSAALAEAFTATDSSVGDPNNPNFSEAQYQAMEEKYGELNGKADEVVGEAHGLQREVASLRDMVTKAPQEEQRLKKGLAEAVSLVDNVEAKSFNVTAQRALLHEAATLLEKMRGMIAERRYGEIPATAKAIQTKYQEAEEGALELVDRQEKMEKAKAGIQEDVSMAEAKIKEAEEVLKKDDPLVSEEARRALSEAGQKLASAKKELKQAEPDYLKASEDCHEAQASAERAMVMGRKRQADAILADLREQMRENPRNVSPEARRQMEEIEASYRRADSGGLSNTDLLLLYMMINQQSHSTMVINQQNIESGTHFADHGYGSRGGYSPSGESSERGSSRDDDGPSGGSTGWGGSEDSGGGGSSDSGGGDSGGGDSGGGDSGGGGDSSY